MNIEQIKKELGINELDRFSSFLLLDTLLFLMEGKQNERDT